MQAPSKVEAPESTAASGHGDSDAEEIVEELEELGIQGGGNSSDTVGSEAL